MDHASEVEENFHLARKVGSLFIGNIIAAMLLDTVPIVLITHALYYYLITEYGHPDAIEYATWSFLTQIIITVPRSQHDPSPEVIGAQILHPIGIYLRPSLAYLLYIHVAASAVTEIIITGQLIVNLWRSRRSIKSLLAALQTKTHHSAEIESNHNATASPEEPILGENCEAYDRSETQSPMTPATLCGTDDGTATLNESIDDKGFQKWNGSKFHENFDTDHEDEKKGKGKEIYGKEINTTSRVQLSSLELV
ncbi:hypothetical protein DXG01_003644 [Tephrocybe rancida]|nr:hypothetical protein DXG01_003644 [Tephrocybe rancida]